MAESRQNLDDVLGLWGKAGGVTVLYPTPSHPPHTPELQQHLPQQWVMSGKESPETLRLPRYPRVWSLDKESLKQTPPLPHRRGTGFFPLSSVQPVASRAATKAEGLT